MKIARCTHCQKPIEKAPNGEWQHIKPTPGLKPFACYNIKIATPARGSIREEK